MKHLLMAVLFLMTISYVAHAQNSVKNKQWKRSQAKTTAAGYWVAESNVKTPRFHTIHFYNADNQLMGNREINGIRLKLDKPATRQMLNDLLEKVLEGWMTEQSATADKKAVGDTTRS